jgi:hypothetical protein
MRLFLTYREAARRRWQYFGRPYLTLVGLAMLVGLVVGAIWVVAGILHFHWFW